VKSEGIEVFIITVFAVITFDYLTLPRDDTDMGTYSIQP
jgi:hypothetical protein